jgi:hypothetical protein
MPLKIALKKSYHPDRRRKKKRKRRKNLQVSNCNHPLIETRAFKAHREYTRFIHKITHQTLAHKMHHISQIE